MKHKVKIFSLLLILIHLNIFNSASGLNHPNFLIHSVYHTNYPDRNSTNNQFLPIQINSTSTELGQNRLNPGSQFQFTSNNNYSSLTIEKIMKYQDLINYDTQFIEEFNSSSSGNMDISFSNETKKFTISKNNSIYGSEIKSSLIIPIYGNETLVFDSLFNQSMRAISGYGFANVEFLFDQFTINFLIDYTETYFSLISNSSQEIFLSNWNDSIPLNSFLLINNLTKPSYLMGINVKTFTSYDFNFTLIINQIRLYRQVYSDTIILDNLSILSLGTPIEFNKSIKIISPLNTVIDFMYKLEFHQISIMRFDSYTFYQDLVHVNFSLRPNFFFFNHSQTLSFSSFFSNLTITLSEIGLITHNKTVFVPFPQTVFVVGDIIPISLPSNSLLNPKQNSTYIVSIPNVDISTAVLVSSSITIPGKLNLGNVLFNIPYNIPKGNVSLFFISSNNKYFMAKTYFLLSPMKISVQPIQVELIYTKSFQLLAYNFFSNTELRVDRIYTYYNNSLRSIENRGIITIFANEFPVGSHVLSLTVLSDGYVDYHVNLEINILPPNLKVEYTIIRKSVDTLEIILLPSNLINSTLLGRLSIIDNRHVQEEIIYSGTYLNLTVSNSTWDNTPIFLTLLVTVGEENYEIFKTHVLIPSFNSMSEESISNRYKFSTVLTYSTLIIIISSLFYRKWKRKRNYVSF